MQHARKSKKYLSKVQVENQLSEIVLTLTCDVAAHVTKQDYSSVYAECLATVSTHPVAPIVICNVVLTENMDS